MWRVMTPTEDTRGLYPDLAEVGGLIAGLQQAFSQIGSPLTVGGENVQFVTYARIGGGNRLSQVYAAAEQRLFMFDFWRNGAMLANGQTAELLDVARAVHVWIAMECSLDVLDSLPSVTLAPNARIYEMGNEVEHRWQVYLHSLGQTFPKLMAFVNEAAIHPELRQLFPFTSLMFFCFSRCTGYPFTNDIPCVAVRPDGSYEVLTPDYRSLGHGTAKEAAAIVIANLPNDCGPAIPGTAEDLQAKGEQKDERGSS